MFIDVVNLEKFIQRKLQEKIDRMTIGFSGYFFSSDSANPSSYLAR